MALSRFQMAQDRLSLAASAVAREAAGRTLSSAPRSLFAAASLHDVLTRLTANFAVAHPQVSIRSSFGASSEMADHILAGAAADLFFSADERQMDRLQEAGALARHSRVDRLSNRLVVICPERSSLVIRRSRDLLAPTVRSVALADPSAPIGNYTRSYLETQHVYEDLLPRAVHLDNPRGVLAAVDGGQADAGIVYQSDMSAARSSRIAYRIPTEDCPAIRYPFALTQRSQNDDSARGFWSFLQSDEASQYFESEGFVLIEGRPSQVGLE